MDSEDKHRLELIGITYNQIESGVYALILRDPETDRRLPIIIGYPEAQAIECKLQEVVTPRPLTHDLMVSVMSAFDLSLIEVNIRKLPSGVFAADLVLSDGERRRTVDARSSDAIALAVRVGAPIYTTSQVLDEAAYSPRGGRKAKKNVTAEAEPIPQPSAPIEITDMTPAQLDEALAKAVKEENYETAARIKKEMDRRRECGIDE